MRSDIGVGPVFIVGAARTGTSLVYKVLCLHPDVSYISNWVSRFPAAPQLAILNRVARSLPGLKQDLWFTNSGNAYVYGRRRRFSERLFPSPVEGEPVYSHCGVGPSGETTPTAQQDLPAYFRKVQKLSGGSVLINKRIANVRRIPLLVAIFPDAKFISVVRDGRAVARSLTRVDWWGSAELWWKGGRVADWLEQGADPWELAAAYWVNETRAMEEGLQEVSDEAHMRIRYETLVDSPVKVFASIARFIGLEANSWWVDAISQLDFESGDDAWRGLPESTLSTLEATQRDLLKHLKYVT